MGSELIWICESYVNFVAPQKSQHIQIQYVTDIPKLYAEIRTHAVMKNHILLFCDLN